MAHVMVDLETASTEMNAVILTLGAVKFDPHSTTSPTECFYRRIDLAAYGDQRIFYDCDINTVVWWMQQDEKARTEAFVAKDRVPLSQALTDFLLWTEGCRFFWSHGKEFDLTILEHAFKRCHLNPPWKFWDKRDTRTIYAAARIDLKCIPFPEGQVQHHALTDCLRQVTAVQLAYDRINKGVSAEQ